MEAILSTPQKLNVTCLIDCGDVIVYGGGNKIKGDVRLSMVAWQEQCHQVQDTVGTSLHWTRYQQQRYDDNENRGQQQGGGALLSTSYYMGTRGAIHIGKAIEARTLTIQSLLRVQARMLNVRSRLLVHVVVIACHI